MSEKQQFNVYLPADLVKRVKHRAIDADKSLSVFVEDALAEHIDGKASGEQASQRAALRIMPIVYVSDMTRSLAFYQAVGCEVRQSGRMWSELRLGGDPLALHQTDAKPQGAQRVGLAMVSRLPLETLLNSLTKAGIETPEGIVDEAFGRSLLIRDPDGLAIQINEHDPDLYDTED